MLILNLIPGEDALFDIGEVEDGIALAAFDSKIFACGFQQVA